MKILKQFGMRFIPLMLFCIMPEILHAQLTPPGGGGWTFPTNLDAWTFGDPTNWPSDKGFAPLSFTNISGSYRGDINTKYAVVVDTTNTSSALLHYRLIDTNGATNLTLDAGSLTFWFSPASWASAPTNGTGPGTSAELISVGQWTTNASFGYWGLSMDAGGTNIYFGAQSNNGSAATYLSAPIAWNTNTWHFIGLTYSATNSALYLDGNLVTNGTGVTILPASNALTNGFFIGSDTNGLAQARGLFDDIYTFGNPLSATDVQNIYSSQYYQYFLNPYNLSGNIVSAPSSLIYTNSVWEANIGSGYLLWVTNTASCITNTNVWITNMVANVTGSGTDQTVNYKFSIAGGLDGVPYDVFAVGALGPTPPIGSTNGTTWSWMGQGYHCNTYMVTGLPNRAAFFILGKPQDSDGDGLTDAFEKLVSHTDPNNADQNSNGIPDGWELAYFGSLQPGDSDYDGDGVSNYQEYLNGTDPNKIKFWLSVTNQYVSDSSVPVSLDVVGGVPSSVTVLLDSTNFGAATWTPFGSNVMVNLGSTEGWHDVWIGARGRLLTSAQNWQWIRVKLDVTAPVLVLTSPSTTTGTQPMIQIQGYSPEPLTKFTYDLTNTSGLVSNQQVAITGQYISTNVWDFTTNYFQAFDVGLAPGTNLITLRATDLAGNTTTTNISFTVSYVGVTNSPTVQLDWPTNGAQISGTNFTWSGFVSDPTATIVAQIVDTNANTNSVFGFVERDGTFWVENLPLSSGTNELTLTVTNAAGNTTVTNISVVQSALTLTMNPVSPDSQLWQSTVNVTGTISDASYLIWVNGVQGTNNGDGTWSANNVPVTAGSAAKFHVVAYAPGEPHP